MKALHEYKLEIIVFISGAVVMVLEMAGSRVMAPYLGTSLFVWTGLIGVIMASLSGGYYWGGKLADRNANYKSLAKIVFIAGIAILVMNLAKGAILSTIQMSKVSLQSASVLGGFVLFAAPSILLGMVSPYSVKLKLENLKTSGVTVGSLYAISTAGSIFGTFAAGFFLISYLGTTNILFLLSIILLILSLIIYAKETVFPKTLTVLLGIFLVAVNAKLEDANTKKGNIDVDTQYNRVLIHNTIDPSTNLPIKEMVLGTQHASAMFLDSDEIVYDYEHYYNLAEYFNPNINKSLILGGAAYSYPKEYLRRYPNSYVDVVEIDLGLTELAKKYFGLEDNPRMQIFHEDARTFLNENTTKYDTIYIDAFSSGHSIPFHLTTKEVTQKVYDSLADGGIVIMNLISAFDGKMGGFLQSEYYTYREIFPQVYVFPVTTFMPTRLQNIVMIALKTDAKIAFDSKDPKYSKYLTRVWDREISNNRIILTDDFSPVERFYKDIPY